MRRFQLTERAGRDLEEIVRSAERISPEGAAIVGRTFLELFELLGRFPTIGARRRAITTHPLRLITIYQCLVVYRPERILVEIVAIVPLADEAERLLSDHYNDEVEGAELRLDLPARDLDSTLDFVPQARLES